MPNANGDHRQQRSVTLAERSAALTEQKNSALKLLEKLRELLPSSEQIAKGIKILVQCTRSMSKAEARCTRKAIAADMLSLQVKANNHFAKVIKSFLEQGGESFPTPITPYYCRDCSDDIDAAMHGEGHQKKRGPDDDDWDYFFVPLRAALTWWIEQGDSIVANCEAELEEIRSETQRREHAAKSFVPVSEEISLLGIKKREKPSKKARGRGNRGDDAPSTSKLGDLSGALREIGEDGGEKQPPAK